MIHNDTHTKFLKRELNFFSFFYTIERQQTNKWILAWNEWKSNGKIEARTKTHCKLSFMT